MRCGFALVYSTKSHSVSWSVSGPWVKSARTYFNSPTFATWIQTVYTAHYSHGEYQFLGPCAYVLTTVQEPVLCDIHNNHFNPFKWKAGFNPKAALIALWSYDTMLAALYTSFATDKSGFLKPLPPRFLAQTSSFCGIRTREKHCTESWKSHQHCLPSKLQTWKHTSVPVSGIQCMA